MRNRSLQTLFRDLFAENSKHGTHIPPAIQASDSDYDDEYECIIISGNLHEDSKNPFHVE